MPYNFNAWLDPDQLKELRSRVMTDLWQAEHDLAVEAFKRREHGSMMHRAVTLFPHIRQDAARKDITPMRLIANICHYRHYPDRNWRPRCPI